MKAEYKEGPEASENLRKFATAILQASKGRNEAAAEGYRPQKVRQETRLEGFLLPRPCRRMVERVCILARELGVGKALASDLRH